MTYHKNNSINTQKNKPYKNKNNNNFKTSKHKSPNQVNNNSRHYYEPKKDVTLEVSLAEIEKKELELEKQFIPTKSYTDRLKPLTKETLHMCVPRILNEKNISKEEYEKYICYNEHFKLKRQRF